MGVPGQRVLKVRPSYLALFVCLISVVLNVVDEICPVDCFTLVSDSDQFALTTVEVHLQSASQSCSLFGSSCKDCVLVCLDAAV